MSIYWISLKTGEVDKKRNWLNKGFNLKEGFVQVYKVGVKFFAYSEEK